MKTGQRAWTKEELMLGINLYSKLKFGQLHRGNPLIIELANIINRTPSSVALKLVNFASIDPKLQARGIKGMSNAGAFTEQVWKEFYSDWDNYFFESEKLLATKKNTSIEELNNIETTDLPKEGKEKERIVKVRLNQSLFRTLVLSNYNSQCCITGIANPELLIASHILPWSKDEKNRLNPANGFLFNALHDKAFETGLLTITEDYTIKIASTLMKQAEKVKSIQQNFADFNDKPIILPKKFKPDIDFIKQHNERFKG